MNRLLNGKIDNKNIGLVKNLWQLRQALDVYCLISANWDTIEKGGVGKKFFIFLKMSCQHLIILCFCKVFEEEKPNKRGAVKHELDSIQGVMRSIDNEKATVLDSAKIRDFVQKYGGNSDKDGMAAISSVIAKFSKENHDVLERFKDLRDKCVAHDESEFNPPDVPLYDTMERLFNFGLDFYMLVSKAFICASDVPYNLNDHRDVKSSLKRMLQKLGFEEIKMEME